MITEGMWTDAKADPHGDDKRKRHRPWNSNVNPGVLAWVRNVASYRCLSRSGSGRFADCFQTSWELLVSDPGDPVVMYADIEGESDNPGLIG